MTPVIKNFLLFFHLIIIESIPLTNFTNNRLEKANLIKNHLETSVVTSNLDYGGYGDESIGIINDDHPGWGIDESIGVVSDSKPKKFRLYTTEWDDNAWGEYDSCCVTRVTDNRCIFDECVKFLCDPHQVCDSNRSRTPVHFLGICVAPLKLNDPCVFHEQCEEGLFCRFGLCSNGMRVGESCINSGTVKLNYHSGNFVFDTTLSDGYSRNRPYCGTESSGCVIDASVYSPSTSWNFVNIPSSFDFQLSNIPVGGLCHGKLRGGEICEQGKKQCSPDPAMYPVEEQQYIDIRYSLPICINGNMSIYGARKELYDSSICERLHLLGEKCTENSHCRQPLTYQKDTHQTCHTTFVAMNDPHMPHFHLIDMAFHLTNIRYVPHTVCTNHSHTVTQRSTGKIVCFADQIGVDGETCSEKLVGECRTIFKTCQPARLKGETCSIDSECHDNLFCYENRCYSTSVNPAKCTDQFDCKPTEDRIPCYTAFPNDRDYQTCRLRGREGASCLNNDHCMEGGLFCMKVLNDPLYHKCIPKRGEGQSCLITSDCAELNCVKGVCRLVGITPSSLDKLIRWYLKYEVGKQAEYCWRPGPLPKYCGPDQRQVLWDCYSKCDAGDTGVGPVCFDGIIPYSSSWKGHLWWCPDNYKAGPVSCEYKCPSTQSEGCAAGCAKDTWKCFTNTVGMVTGPLTLIANVFTAGAAKKFGDTIKGVKDAVVAFGGGAKIKAALVAHQLADISNNLRGPCEEVIRAYVAAKTEEVFDTNFTKWLENAGCKDDSEEMPDCQKQLKSKYANEMLLGTLQGELDADYKTVRAINEVMSFETNSRLTMLSYYDQTGLVGAIAPFVKPQCLFPDTDLSKLITKLQDLPL